VLPWRTPIPDPRTNNGFHPSDAEIMASDVLSNDGEAQQLEPEMRQAIACDTRPVSAYFAGFFPKYRPTPAPSPVPPGAPTPEPTPRRRLACADADANPAAATSNVTNSNACTQQQSRRSLRQGNSEV
jgi:hypothetical protein